jgi:hypothetical protein
MNRLFLRINLTHLHNEEWFNFFVEFKGFVTQATAILLGVEELFARFLVLIQNVDDALEQIRKSVVTDDIARLDERRDSALRMLRAAWKYGMSSLDPTKRGAAEKLEIVFNRYGNLAEKSHNDETASVLNFIQELRGPFASYIATLDLAVIINELEIANNDFEAAILRRNTEAAGRKTYNMYELRRETNRCYSAMLERMEAQALLEGSARFDEFAKTLNANVQRYKNTLARRKTGGREITETKEGTKEA